MTPWRCFHCDAVFTNHGEAMLHFGPTMYHDPACQVDVRELEAQLQSYRNEDTELHRAMYGMRSEHDVALRQAEEQGYARAMRDIAGLAPLWKDLDRLIIELAGDQVPLLVNTFAKHTQYRCRQCRAEFKVADTDPCALQPNRGHTCATRTE